MEELIGRTGAVEHRCHVHLFPGARLSLREQVDDVLQAADLRRR